MYTTAPSGLPLLSFKVPLNVTTSPMFALFGNGSRSKLPPYFKTVSVCLSLCELLYLLSSGSKYA